MRAIVLSLLVCVAATMACQESVESEAALPSGLQTAVPQAVAEAPALLPAYQLEWEKKVPGKVDQADDYRAAHPQWYAITDPPVGNFRPMKEWEPMQSILLTFSDGVVSDTAVVSTLVDTVVASLQAGEVWLVVSDESTKQQVKTKLKFSGADKDLLDERVKYFLIPNDAFWFIDYSPLPLVHEDEQTVAFADFRYYHYRYLDDAIPTRLANELGVTTYRSPFDFEGGNFQADGDQFCYFSERVFGYTGMSFEQVEDIMQAYYGCKEAVVLKDITDDGTGHIDMFFKLGGKHVALVGEYTVVSDKTNEQRMDDNTALLESLVYEDGSGGIKVYRIPFPHPKSGVPRTFINSTLYVSADESVKLNLWPMYTVDKDLEAEALQVWEEAMPDFDHVGILSDQISLMSGAVHCVTRTIPALPFAKWIPDGECVAGACVNETEAGYDWSCIPPAESDPGCWGPKWKCLCNVCSQAGCSFSDDCGDGTCDSGEDCFTCYKDCGCAEGNLCNLVTGDCNQCGDGTCADDENCTSCPADCGCPSGTACSFGVCTQYPCGGIPVQGCCDGSWVFYCGYGELLGEDCGGEGCGWTGGDYACGGNGEDPSAGFGFDCHEYDYPTGCGDKECGDNGGGFSCGECGEDVECLDGMCDGCTPMCEGKECGDDGCEGSCGACEEGFACVDGGHCQAGPEPDCEDKECGDDAAGGSCGECEDGFECTDVGLCEPPEAPVEADMDAGSVADMATGDDLVAGEVGEAEVVSSVEPEEKKSDDGCSTSGRANPGAGLLLLLALALLLAWRLVPVRLP